MSTQGSGAGKIESNGNLFIIEASYTMIQILSSLQASCPEALWRRGGKRKESLQLRLWNLNICNEKVDAKC